MWPMIDSLRSLVEVLSPAFTTPSAATSSLLLLSWLMCLRKKTLLRVGENAHPESPPDHSRRHELDTVYNFFERSAWTPSGRHPDPHFPLLSSTCALCGISERPSSQYDGLQNSDQALKQPRAQ